MVQGTFVAATFVKRPEETIRKINYRQTNMRYAVVVIAIFVVFGCQYCFDTASALQTNIQSNLDKAGQPITEEQFNLLYALYAFPNVVIPLLGGIIIDKYGARIALMLSAMFTVLGQVIFGFGGYKNTFIIMLIGRVVFGIGGQVLHASQNTLISNWFKASELSMVLGICLSFPKMGSSLNSYITPILAKQFSTSNHMNVAGPIFIGSVLMSISLALAIILAYIDRKSEKDQKIFHESHLLSSSQKIKTNKNISINKSKSPVKIVQTSQVKDQPEGVEGGQHLNFKDILKLPVAFWLIILISMLAQALFIPFLDNGNKYYQRIFDKNQDQAGIYLVLPYCVSSLFVVIFGYLIEKFEKRSYVLIASCCFFTFTYLFMMYTETNNQWRHSSIIVWLPSFLLGICIAIFCSIIVPTVPMLVPPKLLGTGFGIMQMLQNLALGIFPLIGGALQKVQGFHLQTLFFFVISCVCVGVSIILKGYDITNGRKLDIKDFRKQYIKKVLQQDQQD